jgi:hypothetical protein
MVEAIKKELEEMESEEQKSFEDEVKENSERDNEDAAQQEHEEENTTKEPEESDEEEESPNDDLAEKQRIYKERQEKRKREAYELRQEQLRQQADNATTKEGKDPDKARLEYLERAAYDIQRKEIINSAKQELSALEKDFVEAYPDYTDAVNDAIEFAKINLMNQGLSEAQALERIEYEKVMTADRAAALGKDPVEAVYKEAQNISKLLETFAEKKGYVKQGVKKKTNLQKQRELSKPNAITGGKGSAAIKKKLTDVDNDELDNMTLGQMLAAKRSGAL